MDIKALEAFSAVMQAGSITAAGRLLARSQPVMTRLIQELETEVGYPLFVRNGPRLAPTEQGFLLYDEVERALSSLKQLDAQAAEIARGRSKTLRVAATPALSANLLPQALRTVDAGDIAGNIYLHSYPAERVAHAVLTGNAQLGVTSLPVEHDALRVHWAGQAACVVVLPEADPLSRLDVVPLQALARRRLVTMSNPYRLRRQIDAALAPAAVLETNSSINALTCVGAGLGVCVMEPLTARSIPLAGTVVKPLDTLIPFRFGVISAQSALLSPALERLVRTVRAVAEQLLPDFADIPPDAAV
ncbi:LysR family transcriptional regulator [Achromobacter denitrificans]|jgi:DNA-binding transcriptional LysR family regulator|uniref:LysR family transcriptional regulator n=1 Tax=Achromobacter denitrificans TaxID=32002 RepID=A0A3R9FYH9_ACHDE|nr:MULTISPECIES: LysR substrate-binding domain-containing protein [Achromobacter]ASC67743.1 LysR family transcriptional regulator [Achromobacter denitrificans]MBV2158514.1 LysR family transcriptional regulator [Achromobacter denitrificans]MDF3857145.1 LysR substrate-binding domain-containing protein [Achromobacter denitrificans]MDX3878325.1 LysR substrate-binding domain-containing protein [Achromobacter sp.]MPT39160.1 LysR family transcriptional regulator [Achromobacter sp.]